MSNIKYSVYWVHLPEHTNRFLEGYVGITKDVEKRWGVHKRHDGCKVFHKAIKKYGDTLVWDVLFEGIDKELAELIEFEYRPSEGIGWNLRQGGYAIVHTKETLDKISKTHLGKMKTKESITKRAKTLKCEIICMETGIVYKSALEAANQLGISNTGIYRVLKGQRKVAGGYHWKYTRKDTPEYDPSYTKLLNKRQKEVRECLAI